MNNFIKGLGSCLNKMQNIIEEFKKPESYKEIAKEAEQTAKMLVPVKSGKLQNSIKGKVEGRGSNAVVALSARTSYASHVEYGTSKMPARPFLRPAIEEAEIKLAEVAKDNIKRAVK